MASALGDVTPYLVVLVAVATLGPLQFGYHLVRGCRPQAEGIRSNIKLPRPN